MAISRPKVPSIEPVYDPNTPNPTITLLSSHPLPNTPPKFLTLLTLLITYPPLGSTEPHTHPYCFISTHILSEHMLVKLENNNGEAEEMRIYGPGETYTEGLEARHILEDNVSDTEEASMIVSVVVETKALEELGLQGLESAI